MAANFLCIGGPKDGQRVDTINDKDWFYAFEQPRLSAEETRVGITHVVNRTTYHLRLWRTGDGARFFVWTPQGQTDAETMAALLKAYEERPKR